ncbi:hypothetical protein ACWEAF_35870 [Streptomyces sp. NPDC005071]
MINPLSDRARRLSYNKRLRGKNVPAQACNTCFAVKGHAAFARAKAKPSGRQPMCRTCDSERKAAYRAENADAIRQRKAAHHAANAKVISERKAAYRAENIEALKGRDAANYAKNRESVLVHKTAYRAENAARNADRVQRADVDKACRRCGEIKPETAFALDRIRADGLRSKCRDCDNGAYRAACRSTHGDPVGTRCYLCAETIASEADAQADHLVPQSRGGGDEGFNTRWVHGPCNNSRNTKPTTVTQLLRIVPGILPAGHPLRVSAGL